MRSVKEFEKKRQFKIDEICAYRKEARKNRALLSYKYDSLKFKMNLIQVFIIIISTMITFLEAVGTHYNFDAKSFNVATITMSTMIAFIMAIYRFFRIEENKENIKQSLENHVFIINKLHKIIHQMENFNFICDENNQNNENNYSIWEQLESNYDGEIFDNYISIKEKFDAQFSFQDSIYYKRKYKRDFLELEFTNKEIELVDKFKGFKHNEFILRLKGCLYYILCCIKRERVDYTSFMKKAEKGELKKMAQPSSSKITHPSSQQRENTNTQNPSPPRARIDASMFSIGRNIQSLHSHYGHDQSSFLSNTPSPARTPHNTTPTSPPPVASPLDTGIVLTIAEASV